jgi:hypothetical protein
MNTALRCTSSAAAGNGLGTTIKQLVKQIEGAGINWAKAHVHKSWERIHMTPPVIACWLRALKIVSDLASDVSDVLCFER